MEANFHAKAPLTSILVCAPSKSSKYTLVSPSNCVFRGFPAIKLATSPRKDICDGAVVSMVGSLLINRVKKGTSVEKLVLNPIMVLFTGSVP